MPLGLSDNLFQRIVSALALLPFVLGLIYLGGWWFFFLLAIGGYLMVAEWNGMTGTNSRPATIFAAGIAALLAALFVAPFDGAASQETLLSLALLILFAVLAVFRPAKIAAGFSTRKKQYMKPLVGFSYVTMALISLAWLRGLDADGLIVLWLFFAVWAMDVGGYFAGKGIGGPKLAPKLSPKKTWAGLIGGIVLAALVSAAISYLFNLWSPLPLAAAGALTAFVSQMGDLYESAIKRHMHVKDSGMLIPGHGGILDRVDGLIFAAPFVALVLAATRLLGGS